MFFNYIILVTVKDGLKTRDVIKIRQREKGHQYLRLSITTEGRNDPDKIICT